MKKTLALLIAMVMMFTAIGSVSAASSNVPTFKVDGKLFVTPKGEPQPYINKDNRTMGSLRLIANAVGVESKNIKWDNAKQTATLKRGNNTVSVTVGKKVISVNGKNVTMDTVAEMKQNRVFIPARFIAQGLGVKINFDSASNTVNFITGTNEVVNNNFADYGMKQLEKLPLTLTANGLEVTYHEAFLYKTDSAEVQALQDKYVLSASKNGSHLLWMKVTITNKSTKTIRRDAEDLENKIGVTHRSAYSMSFVYARTNTFDEKGDYLNTWVLEPNESITGYVSFVKKDDEKIEFVSLETINRNSVASKRIATKE